MSPALTIATTRDLVAFSSMLVEQRHGQAETLDLLGKQIADGAHRIASSRSKVVYIFDQVRADRNLLGRRAVLQAERNRAAEPVPPTGWGDL